MAVVAKPIEMWMKRNDTRPTFTVQLRENVGLPTERPIAGLPDADEINFIMRPLNSSAGDPKVKQPMSVLFNTADPDDPDWDEKGGWVEYAWQAADLDTHGDFSMEVEITWAPGAVETIPNKGFWTLHVELDLG